jgi:hypothetical protein
VETEMQKRKSGFCRDVNASFLLVADVGKNLSWEVLNSSILLK